MIRREFVTVVAGELPHLSSEPLIACALYIFRRAIGLDLMRDTPGWRPTTSAFLGNSKGNPLVERPGKERHLPGIGASGHCEVFHIDGQRVNCLMGSDLHAIDDTAHSPGPGGVLTRIAHIPIACSSAKFRVKLVERIRGMVSDSKRKAGYLVMDEVDGCYRAACKNAGRETAIIAS